MKSELELWKSFLSALKRMTFLFTFLWILQKTNTSVFHSYCWEYLVISKYKLISYFKLSNLIKDTFKQITKNKLSVESNIFK